MEQRLSLITLGIKDLAISRKFYENVLGWQLSSAGNEHIAFYQMNGFAFGLYSRKALAEDAGVAAEPIAPFSGITLAHNVRQPQEVDTTINAAVQAGAKLVKPAQDVFWGGRSGYFADPDGYLWEIAWNPGFVLDAAGNIQLPF